MAEHIGAEDILPTGRLIGWADLFSPKRRANAPVENFSYVNKCGKKKVKKYYDETGDSKTPVKKPAKAVLPQANAFRGPELLFGILSQAKSSGQQGRNKYPSED
jgi:hypothetical protein